jgi:replicative DNA helicase
MQESKDYKGLYNIEAEQIIIGKIISNNDYYAKISDILHEEYFYELAHREIYKYISKVIQRSSIIADSVTLKSFFDTNDILVSIGGSNYLSILLSMSSGIADVVSYAKLVQDFATKRKLVLIGEELVAKIYSDTTTNNSHEQIEIVEGQLFELSNKNDVGKGFINIAGPMAEVVTDINVARNRDTHISGVSCGLMDLDRMLGGFQKSDLIILAGRPGMGKTTLAINMAYNAALEFKKNGENKSVGFFSLEMPAVQIVSKILSLETGINTDRFRKGEIHEDEFINIVNKADIISTAPIFIDDTAALTIPSIKTRIRRLIKQENLSFVVIDYLGLIHGINESSKRSKVTEVTEITQGLKAIAKEFNIPVLALSQLSRGTESREGNKPVLSDLRDSGSIEQDADIVMFIFREYYYKEKIKPKIVKNDENKDGSVWNESNSDFILWQKEMAILKNTSELIIAKHRNGPVGSITLHFNAETSKFSDYDGYHNED